MRIWLIAALVSLPGWVFADDPPKAKHVEMSDEERGVLDRTNAERKSAGVPPLVPNAKLFQAAREHATNMARQGKLDHVLDGKSPGDRVTAAGYPWSATAENIAWKSPGPEQVVKLWMDSPGHKTNLLNKDYDEIGIAVAVNSKGERYWVQVFGRQK
jgi:uncharacterized protein YkwD